MKAFKKEEAYLKKYHLPMWLAMKCHRTHTGDMMDFRDKPYLLQIFMDNQDKSVIKSTQCGLTEYLIILAISLAMQGKSIFYVLPTLDLVGRFVRNRIDRSFDFSKFYSSLYKDGGSKSSNTISLKHIANGTIAFVGSNTPKPFTEFPADISVIDEKDQCNQANIEMAWERMSMSKDRRQFFISNPTILNYGIHNDWLESNQFLWHIKGDCGHYIQPDFFKHVIKDEGEENYRILDPNYEWNSGSDINLICDKCGKPVNRRNMGKWIPTYKNKKHGYHISKLFTTNVPISEIVTRFKKGLLDPVIMQRVYNADLGLAYTAKGAKIDREMILDCIDANVKPGKGLYIAGIDVGGNYTYVILQVLPDNKFLLADYDEVPETATLLDRLKKYNVKVGVIDGLPETREARSISNYLGFVLLCYYGATKADVVNLKKKMVTVNRTSSLDAVKALFMTQRIVLPGRVANDANFINQLTAATRVQNDKGLYEWRESTPDHFHHAFGYSLIASRLIAMFNRR